MDPMGQFKHVQTSLGISRIPTSNIPQATATSQKKKALCRERLVADSKDWYMLQL